jgi:hypothetical protein
MLLVVDRGICLAQCQGSSPRGGIRGLHEKLFICWYCLFIALQSLKHQSARSIVFRLFSYATCLHHVHQAIHDCHCVIILGVFDMVQLLRPHTKVVIFHVCPHISVESSPSAANGKGCLLKRFFLEDAHELRRLAMSWGSSLRF